MSTGPIHIEDSINRVREIYERTTANPNWALQSSSNVLGSRLERDRPLSKSNPIRSDFTRKPSSWDCRKKFGSMPRGVVGYRHPFSGTHVEYRGCVTALDLSGAWIVPEQSGLYDRALYQALTNIQNQKVNLGVAFVEARRTAALVGDTAKTVAKSLDNFMSRNWRGIGRMGSWKKIPGSYLQWCYGVTPLMSDIFGSAETLANLMTRGHQFNLTASGVGQVKFPWRLVNPAGTGTVIWEGEQNQRVQVALCYYLPSSMLPNVASMGLSNPVEVLWETVPYSFVLDWFLPIGPWLGALDAGAYLTFREGSISRWRSMEAEGRYGPGTDSGSAVDKYSSTWLPGRLEQFRFTRTVLTTVPWPAFPSLRKPLRLDQLAQGLSLLTQVFQRWR